MILNWLLKMKRRRACDAGRHGIPARCETRINSFDEESHIRRIEFHKYMACSLCLRPLRDGWDAE